MNEIKLIHLGRTAFTIALDAHAELRVYLAAIKKRAGADVLEEVEIRMAELLTERGFDEKKVVLSGDVEYLKSQLGEPNDFGDSDESEAPDEIETDDTAKRLYRDTSEGWLGGVASGLGAYLGFAPWIVRLAFILLTFAWGSSIIVYIILWILLPEAKTPSDRLRMQGKPVTVDTIKELVNKTALQDGVEDIRATAKSVTNGTWHKTPRGTKFGNAMAALIRVGLAVVGVSIMIGAVIGIFMAIGFGSYALTNSSALFGGVELFPVGAAETWMAVLAITVVSLMGVLLALAGLSLVREKWPAPGWLTGSIVAVILVGITAGIPMLGSVAPKLEKRYDAAHITTTRQVDQFTSVIAEGSYTHVTYEPSETYQVVIKSFGKVDLSRVTSSVSNNALTVQAYDYTNDSDCGLFCIEVQDIDITIKSPTVESVEVRDGAMFESNKRLNQSTITTFADDASSLSMSYINPQKATVFDENGLRGVTLEGLSNASSNDALYSGEFFTITQAKEVVYSQASTCQSDYPLLSVLADPVSITIGSNVFTDSTVFRTEREKTSNSASIINCITISEQE